MSLYYGHDEQNGIIIPRSNDFFTTFTYGALTTTLWELPMDLLLGHPKPVPYVGKYITEDTTLEVYDYTFDKDGTITNLIVELQLIIFAKDGSTYAYELGDVNVSDTMLPFSTRNVSLVDLSYKLSEYHPDYKNIALVYIKVKKVSGTEAGNESTMNVRISY